MKRLYSISLPLVGILFFSFTAVLLTDTGARLVLDELLSARVAVLERAYQGQADYETTETLLSRLEADPLLSQDMEALKAWNETEYDRVWDMQIQWCRRLSENDLGMVLQARIRWDMADLEGEYTIWEEYLFQVEKRALPQEGPLPGAVTGGKEIWYRLTEMKVL